MKPIASFIFFSAIVASPPVMANQHLKECDVLGLRFAIEPSFPVLETYSPVTGKVKIQLVVNSDGKIGNMNVISSSSSNGSKIWEEAFATQAIKAVSEWQYENPACACNMAVEIEFVNE